MKEDKEVEIKDRRFSIFGLSTGNWLTLMIFITPFMAGIVYTYVVKIERDNQTREIVDQNSQEIKELPRKINKSIKESEARTNDRLKRQEKRAVKREDDKFGYIRDLMRDK